MIFSILGICVGNNMASVDIVDPIEFIKKACKFNFCFRFLQKGKVFIVKPDGTVYKRGIGFFVTCVIPHNCRSVIFKHYFCIVYNLWCAN